jgi:hypothetical protein
MHQIPTQPYLFPSQDVYAASVRERILEWGVLFLLFTSVPLLAMADVLIIGKRVPEFGFLETFQASVLMIVCVLTSMVFFRQRSSRSLTIWMLAFFLMMEVREHDWLFDQVAEDVWKVLVALILFSAFAVWFPLRSEFRNAFARFAHSPVCDIYLTGVIVVLVFSRLLGTKSLMGLMIRGDVMWHVKALVQESLEALGYDLLLFASLKTYKRTVVS